METSIDAETVVVLPGEAKSHHAFGDRVTFHLTGAETEGKLCSFTIETPPGGGPPPHHHDREDEWFLVLEGRVEFLKNGEWAEVPPGGAVFAPKGSVHAFRNIGEQMLRLLVHTTPAGFEDFFAAMAQEFHRNGGPDFARVEKISADFGIFFH